MGRPIGGLFCSQKSKKEPILLFTCLKVVIYSRARSQVTAATLDLYGVSSAVRE